jgi:hypothetical protein
MLPAEVLEMSQKYLSNREFIFIFAPRLDFGYASKQNLNIQLLM